MKLIKKNIFNLQSIPKNTQWLLLAAAFILVLIMLTLVLTDHKSATVVDDDTPVNLTITPDSKSIDWTDTPLNVTKTETFTIGATAAAKVLSVEFAPEIAGMTQPQETCSHIGEIDDKITCTITIKYKPNVEMMAEKATLTIKWHVAAQPDEMQKTNTIEFVVGAKNTKKIVTTNTESETQNKKIDYTDKNATSEKTVTTHPVEKDVVASTPTATSTIPTITPDEYDNVDDTDDMIDIIDTPKVNNTKTEKIVSQPISPAPEKSNVVPRAESCSDFAFPGYDTTGKQIGWIRPEKGSYYFHPFSDKKCDTPTGKYNPDTGMIYDINNAGKKIGTDADHMGRTNIRTNGVLPQLSSKQQKNINRAKQLDSIESFKPSGGGMTRFNPNAKEGENAARNIDTGLNITRKQDTTIVGTSGEAIFSSDPFDRTFVLRQYKPIPATIVSEVRADPSLYNDKLGSISLPVRATVDRNVYSDNGRTVIIPTGTLLLGYVTGTLPGPYKSIGRMDIKWYQFILPNGVEFNFGNTETDHPFSGDSQGRSGVPGHGSTDYVQQMVMPMLTAIVPAAVNMIAPISDKFINQINLDNNTVVQSGTVRSSELAKNEIVTAWNQIAQKLMVDMLDNTVPPFSIAAGTRITVYSPNDLVITCGDDNSKKCSVKNQQKNVDPRNKRATLSNISKPTPDYNDGSWVGQARSFSINRDEFCDCKSDGSCHAKTGKDAQEKMQEKGYDFTTIEFYCQTLSYKAINNAKQEAVYQNQKSSSNNKSINSIKEKGDKTYNEQVLGLKYDADGAIENPFAAPEKPSEPAPATITCEDGTVPDTNGCCTGEIYTDMGEQGFNCCPETGGDCFPPIPM